MFWVKERASHTYGGLASFFFLLSSVTFLGFSCLEFRNSFSFSLSFQRSITRVRKFLFFLGGGGERGGLEDRLLFIRHYSRCVVVSIGLST